MVSTLLYPVDSITRRSVSLNGMWGFQTDPQGTGQKNRGAVKLPAPDEMPVPASFADCYTDKAIR